MKAITYIEYGKSEKLTLSEIQRPEPAKDEVLIKVLASAVNKADWHLLTGTPFPIRFMSGMSKPKNPVLGADASGIVERVGNEVTQFKPGDEVFGDLSSSGFGGFAEYATIKESRLAKKPSNLSFEESASLPLASVTALQGLRDKGLIKEGDDVLINGASGGVGSYAVQIAKAFGANVTAVCSTGNVDMAQKLGADKVIDYKKEDFTKSEKKYDLIFDVVANRSVSEISKVMKKGGRYISCAFSMEIMMLGPVKKLLENKLMTTFLATVNQADLQYIAKLAEEEKLKPVINRTFTLDDTPEALKIMGEGSSPGKMVISI